MTLFIACLLIYEFGLDPRWYVIAVFIWVFRTIVLIQALDGAQK